MRNLPLDSLKQIRNQFFVWDRQHWTQRDRLDDFQKRPEHISQVDSRTVSVPPANVWSCPKTQPSSSHLFFSLPRRVGTDQWVESSPAMETDLRLPFRDMCVLSYLSIPRAASGASSTGQPCCHSSQSLELSCLEGHRAEC